MLPMDDFDYALLAGIQDEDWAWADENDAAVSNTTVSHILGAITFNKSTAPPELVARRHSSFETDPVQRFKDFFKPMNRHMQLENPGTFHIQAPFTLQYISASQPVPDGTTCKFIWFQETWLSHIDYVLLGDGKTTALKFRIVHMASGMETSRVETMEQARARNKVRGYRTICNSVFLKAVERCTAHVASLPINASTTKRAYRLLGNEGKRKCTESTGLFGLRHPAMREACLEFLNERK